MGVLPVHTIDVSISDIEKLDSDLYFSVRSILTLKPATNTLA